MLIYMATLCAANALAQIGGRYFPSTSHYVRGDFLNYFERWNGEYLFGLPLTDELDDGGWRVQYFERARMELHPEHPPTYRVQLTLLGDLLGYRAAPIPLSAIPPAHPDRRYYPQTGHTVSYSFLQFFDSRGGLDVFGYPITELLTEGGTTVQYFQRAKMEWHPENPIGSQMTLANLGSEYLSRYGQPSYNPAPVLLPTQPVYVPAEVPPAPWLPLRVPTEIPLQPNSVPTPITPSPVPVAPFVPAQPGTLRVVATVKYAITGQGGSQTVYVQVTDDQGLGLSGAQVQVVVHFHSGDQIFSTAPTDASGSAAVTFNIGYPPPGYTVLLEARASYAGQTETAWASYVPWW
jgi:hypothetical protein